jgi:MoaA/NifB/PqqE/SkfB family radical SAM enzyme
MNTTQFTVESLKEHIGGRQLYMYGAGPRGRTWSSFFTHHKFSIAGFIDKSKTGTDTFPPSIIEEPSFRKNAFIVITVPHAHSNQIQTLLQKHGLEKTTDYLNHTQLCSYYPTIEVSGICNLICMSCNLGSSSEKRSRGGFMNLDTYKKVLEKLIKDIPFVSSVYLYLWGEPLLNPELPQIIEYTRQCGLGVEISTNLNKCANLEKVIQAAPDYLIVPCSGTGKNYELTHTGGKWDLFEQNLHKLKEHITRYNVRTGVEVVYHVYKHNLTDDYDYVEHLAKNLGFSFKPVIANIFPERILELVAFGTDIPEAMKEASKRMINTIDDQIQFSQEKNKKCVMMNAFPVIRWNGSVIPCCNMEGGTIADNYLDVSLEELKRRQVSSSLCKTCISFKLQHAFYISGEIKTIGGIRQIVKS